MAETIVYKNHCVPQEQATFSGESRWYLDSDSGKKLSGSCESKASTTGTLVANIYSSTITLNSTHFIYLKNTDTSGSNYLLLNIGSMGARIKLMPGESFASDVGTSLANTQTVVITASGTPRYEYIHGT